MTPQHNIAFLLLCTGNLRATENTAAHQIVTRTKRTWRTPDMRDPIHFSKTRSNLVYCLILNSFIEPNICISMNLCKQTAQFSLFFGRHNGTKKPHFWLISISKEATTQIRRTHFCEISLFCRFFVNTPTFCCTDNFFLYCKTCL